MEFSCHFIRACCVLHNMCMGDAIFNDVQQNQIEGTIGNESTFNSEFDEEEERNEVGLHYRNYVGALIDI